jgi:hypothetical protein
MKKKLLFYGNCHASTIATWVNTYYSDKYEVIDSESSGLLDFHGTYKNFAVWVDSVYRQTSYADKVHECVKKADYFIYQPIEQAACEALHTNYLIENIVTGASICIPNNRFFGYPVCEASLAPVLKYIYKEVTKNRRDIFEYLVNEKDPKFSEILLDKASVSIEDNKKRLQEKAHSSSIKIDMTSFIESNWKSDLLFGCHHHPIGVYWAKFVANFFSAIGETVDESYREYLRYPSQSKVLNIKKFSFVNDMLPNITLPSDIDLIRDPTIDIVPESSLEN